MNVLPRPLLTLDQVAERDEELADAINGFRFEIPEAIRDAGLPNGCGPVAFAFAVYLRAHHLPGGLVHVTGTPPRFPPKTGHYLPTSDWLVCDWTYRQYDQTAPLVVLYPRANLLDGPGLWRSWTAISGELEADDPLYPDFVEYPGCAPLEYVPAHLRDPEWVTPIDSR